MRLNTSLVERSPLAQAAYTLVRCEEWLSEAERTYQEAAEAISEDETGLAHITIGDALGFKAPLEKELRGAILAALSLARAAAADRAASARVALKAAMNEEVA